MPWKECQVVDQRVRFVRRFLDGEPMTSLCEEFGISRKTGYKIFQRYEQIGVRGLGRAMTMAAASRARRDVALDELRAEVADLRARVIALEAPRRRGPRDDADVTLITTIAQIVLHRASPVARSSRTVTSTRRCVSRSITPTFTPRSG